MDLLQQLVEKIEHSFSGRLVSVILYGSAAAPARMDQFSDLNVLCVLKQITPRELADAEPILRWWREQGNPSPLLMTEEEVASSADSFPIEFHDMKWHRKVLSGTDPIAHLTVEDTHYRAQLEHQLRSGLLRLRQRGAALLSDPVGLLRLCADSVSTFCMLGRHAMQLTSSDGNPQGSLSHLKDRDRKSVVHALSERLQIDMQPFNLLLEIRETKQGGARIPDSVSPEELFAQYLICIEKLITFVDHAFDGRTNVHSHS